MLRDESFETFDVLPLTGALGAEIRGVDLAAIDDQGIVEVKRALYTYNVLAVRGQKLTPAGYQKVARRFGPFSGNPVHTPMEGFKDIVKFVREPDDTGKVIGEEWHMDLAWMAKPPGITMLYGEVIPPVGGDTCFASLTRAYKSLSPSMLSFLKGQIGIHSGKGVFAINAAHAKRLGTLPEAQSIESAEVEHPVICAHAATGKPYLFVSSVMTKFKGMTEAESKPIIDFLMARATQPEFTCRVRWEEGTLSMWDNPYVLHTAINDYPGYRRVTYRTTVEGPVPSAVVEKKPASVGRVA